MNWQAVFFDFDGVIIDSVDVKTQAFATMFRSYGPDVERAVVNYHLSNGGVSRFEKFEYYYKHILKKPISQQIMDELGREFNQLAYDGVLAAPFMDGALDALNQLKQEKVPAFVVSGTPQEELQHIVAQKNIGEYFLEVHGSPRKKDDIVKDLSNRYAINLEDCLFIGDATTDYIAAKNCAAKFLGIVKKTGKSPFPNGTPISPIITFD